MQQPTQGIVVKISLKVLRVDGLAVEDESDYCVQWARGKSSSGLTDWARASQGCAVFLHENSGVIPRSVIPIAGSAAAPKTLKLTLIHRARTSAPSSPIASLRYPLKYETDIHRNTVARFTALSSSPSHSSVPVLPPSLLTVQFELHVVASVVSRPTSSAGQPPSSCVTPNPLSVSHMPNLSSGHLRPYDQLVSASLDSVRDPNASSSADGVAILGGYQAPSAPTDAHHSKPVHPGATRSTDEESVLGAVRKQCDGKCSPM